jgi:hypothetical protein
LLPRVGWGKWKWNAYLILEKNISILAKVTQVSDVAHGPLVTNYGPQWSDEDIMGKTILHVFILEKHL